MRCAWQKAGRSFKRTVIRIVRFFCHTFTDQASSLTILKEWKQAGRKPALQTLHHKRTGTIITFAASLGQENHPTSKGEEK
jgi:hypothetical protein